MKLNSAIAVIFGSFILAASPAFGAQFTATADICTTASCDTVGTSYTGASAGTTTIFSVTYPLSEDVRGAVMDGGDDAFDYFGYVANIGSLSLNRQTELLGGNIFRFYDSYTNNTGSTINTTISFVGDLGSDGETVYSNVNAFRQTSSDSGPFDPIVGFIWGNNGFASSMVRTTGQGGNGGAIERTAIATNLSVAAGQTVSLMYFAFLAKDLDTRSGDVTLALNTINGLFSTPNFSGLTSQQQSRTLNWGASSAVPEPSTALLTLGGLAAVALLRRRRA